MNVISHLCVFFGFLGFDQIATVSEEAARPTRDVPRAVLASNLVCTTLYVLVALSVCGVGRLHEFGVGESALGRVFSSAGAHWMA